VRLEPCDDGSQFRIALGQCLRHDGRGVASLVQPLAVFRQAYGSNWFSVAAKWTIANSLYFTALSLIFTLGLTVALYQS
ncbi:MAG: hypothetical protein AAGJ87_02855, partial [Pseudomonadota bacterium]